MSHSVNKSVEVAKLDDEQQLVFGWAWVSKDANGELVVDSQGEAIEPDDLELAARDFMVNARGAGQMHEGEAIGNVVESFVLTPEKAKTMGIETQAVAWWVGMHIPDEEAFAKVKSGEFSMFSIQGLAETVDG